MVGTTGFEPVTTTPPEKRAINIYSYDFVDKNSILSVVK